jgi:hypothetical protein
MTDTFQLLRGDHDEVRRLLSELGAQLEQARTLAPTRPPPSLPPDPEVQRLAGRIARATDRIRDVLAGRNGS